MKFLEIASPDILRMECHHHVAKNFGNTFCLKFRQQLQKLVFSIEKTSKSVFSIAHFGIEGDAAGQKKFLTRCTPFIAKMRNRKCRFWRKIQKKNLIFEIVAEISDRKCCRNFWQHDGDPLPQ